MSIDHYKGEAKRLGAHLSASHGVKLKHSAILESIAAVHGARSWNALLNTPRTWAGRLTKALRVDGKPKLDHRLAVCDLPFHVDPHGLNLGLSDDCSSVVSLSYAAARRHILVSGSPGTGAAEFLEGLVLQHIANGGGALVLDPLLGETSRKRMEEVCAQTGRDDFKVLGQDGALYDPLASLKYEQDSIKEHAVLLLAICAPGPSKIPGEQLRRIFEGLLWALLEMKREATLQSLRELLSDRTEGRILSTLDPEGTAGALLRQGLNPEGALTSSEVDDSLYDATALFLQGLEHFCAGPAPLYGTAQVCTCPVGVVNSCVAGEVLYAPYHWCSLEKAQCTELFLRELALGLKTWPGPKGQPLMVLVGLGTPLSIPLTLFLLKQATALNIVLVLHVQGRASLSEDAPTYRKMLEMPFTKILFPGDGEVPEIEHLMVNAIAGHDSDSNAVERAKLFAALRSMNVGDAYVSTPGFQEKVKMYHLT